MCKLSRKNHCHFSDRSCHFDYDDTHSGCHLGHDDVGGGDGIRDLHHDNDDFGDDDDDGLGDDGYLRDGVPRRDNFRSDPSHDYPAEIDDVDDKKGRIQPQTGILKQVWSHMSAP